MPETIVRKRPHPGFKNGRERWTDAQNQLLKKHWGTGLSTPQIGKLVGDRSTQAVRLQARRLGLGVKPFKGQRCDKGIKRIGSPMTESTQTPAPRPPKPKVGPPPVEPTVGPMGLRGGQCNWPIGDPGHQGFGFCGRRTASTKPPYCAEHLKVAFQPTQYSGSHARNKRI